MSDGPGRSRRWPGPVSAPGVIAAVLALLGVMALAVVGGFVLAVRTETAAAGPAEPKVTPLPSQAVVTGVVMPDVRGLDVAAARQVLADAGVPAASVSTATAPAAGAAGLVVGQQPVFGTAAPGAVTLTVSSAASVPDVTGEAYADAAAKLAALQVTVRRALQYVPGATAGTVVSTSPKAGAALPQQVDVVVAAPAASVFLDSLNGSGGTCEGDDALQMAGSASDHAFECGASSDGSGTTWVLSKRVDRFQAVVGVPDDTSAASSRPQLRVLLDGVVVAKASPRLGTTSTLDLRTTGAVQLRIEAVSPTGSGTVGIGDARLLGAAGALAALATTP